MSQTAKTAREAMKAKAKRLASADPHTKVDSSTWTPPEAENASSQTGMRPVSKRAFKKGGKVIGKAEGHKSAHRADRMPRKSGGKALTANSLINRNAKDANEERDGIKHIGGLRHGGRAHKFSGGVGENPVGMQNRMMGQAAGMRKHGGKTMSRRHREYGGADPIGAMIEANPEPMREMETLNAKSPQTEQAPPPEKKMPHKAIPKGGLPGEKRGGRTDGHKVEWLHSKKSHHAKGGKAMHPDEAEDKKLIKKMVKPSALEHKKHGSEAHGPDCRCHKCWGGKTEKNKGGGVFKGEGYPFKVSGEVKGGRSAHAHGGKAGGKGKMNVNIVIASGHHGKDAMGNQPMPNAPVSPRTPPAGAGMPMPPPGMMPPGGGAPGAGGPPMPPPGMMPRKAGGRTNYPIDSASGGGQGRLEKIKAYGLTPPRKK